MISLLAATTCLFLTGCTASSTNTITVQDFTFSLPSTFTTVSATTLDQAQIVHSIIAAWRWEKSNLILSESSLPVKTTLQQFTQQSQSRLHENMIGYTNGKISSSSFTCNGVKIPTYKHSFEQTQLQDNTKTSMYYDQLYFIYHDSVYILSLAQQEKKDTFSTIATSLWCKSINTTKTAN